jgi:hypothetical protein
VASSSGDLIAEEGSESEEPHADLALGGRQGRHSDAFQDIWDVMTKNYRENPGASW